MKEPKYYAYRTKILGKKWTIFYCSEKYYNKRHGKDWAITDLNTKKIYFRYKHLTKETIVHELGHAFLSEICISATEVNHDQLEEIFCDMLAKHGKKLLSLADQVYAAYTILSGRSS